MSVKAQAGPTFVAAILISPFIFQVGFNFGAFDNIAIEHLLAAWTASAAALAASFLVGGENAPGHSGTWWMRAILLLPTLWITTEWCSYLFNSTWLDLVEVALRLVMMVVSAPAIVITLLSAAYPGVNKITVPRFRYGLWVIFACTALMGWWVGSNHAQFITCQDFERSGTYVPEDCWSGGMEESGTSPMAR